MESRRALLVEDNDRVREVFAAYLSHDGWTVTEATDGAQGFSCALAARPDLIVTDIMMPNVDGVELLQRLRAEPGLAEVPVLVVSAYAGMMRELDSVPGRLQCLTKPVTLPAFQAAIRKLLAPPA